MSIQVEFGFAESVTAPYVRPAVLSYKPFNAGGWDAERNKRVTYSAWLEWSSALNGGVR